MATSLDHLMRWWRTGVVYQIYPRSFCDGSGDGVGDIEGIISKLDYLSGTLGVTAIWLSPVYPSPMIDFGYDVQDYCNVDPVYGTLETLDELIHAAHARDLRVLLDWVPNHTSDQHPWFIESRSSRSSLKRDWYFWRDPSSTGGPPNNWLSTFGGSAWTLDEYTGQYYLHSFLKEQPDLNWRNPEVQFAMFDSLKFWLDRGVDGFRIDVVHRLMKDSALRDNPPSEHQKWQPNGQLAFESQVHVYNQSNPDIHRLLRDLRRVLDEYGTDRPRVAVGEVHVPDVQEWTEYMGRGDELHMPFNFALLESPWEAGAIRRVIDSTEGAVPSALWPNYVLGNHDTPRVASRIGEAQARAAMLLLLTLCGSPTIYYGEELGMSDTPIRPEQRKDPAFHRTGDLSRSRDPQRTPMPWHEGPNAGFCPEGTQPWLPLADNTDDLNVERQLRDPTSMLNLTRRLLRFRREHEALLLGRYRPVDDVPQGCFVFERYSVNETFLVAVNFSGRTVEVMHEQLEGARVIVSSLVHDRTEILSRGLQLAPYEACVVHQQPLDPAHAS